MFSARSREFRRAGTDFRELRNAELGRPVNHSTNQLIPGQPYAMALAIKLEAKEERIALKKLMALMTLSCTVFPLCAQKQEDTAKPMTSRPTNGCWSIGNTVTIVGRVDSGRNFVPLEPLCVHYPTPAENHSFSTLEFVESVRIPVRLYVEVRAEILDGFPYHVIDIAIKVTSVRDVDDAVNAYMDKEKRNCEQWQKENSPKLAEQTHGGVVVPTWNFDQIDSRRVRTCGLWADDTVLPHKRIDMRRTPPRCFPRLPCLRLEIGGQTSKGLGPPRKREHPGRAECQLGIRASPS
jgi:hypothetical protein